MKKTLYIGFISASVLFSSLLLSSCDNYFHAIIGIMNEVSTKNNILEPKRIFLGGTFDYEDGSVTRSGLAVLDGSGYVENGYFNPNHIGLSALTGTGVYSLLLTDSSLYVAGDFEGYKDDLATNDPNFKCLQKYFPDGVLDSAYNPGNQMTIAESINDIAEIGDENIIVGGDFTSLISNYLSVFDPSGAESNPYPSITGGSRVNSLFQKEDNSLYIGGYFTEIDTFNSYPNYAGYDESLNRIDPGVEVSSKANDEIFDIEMNNSEDVLYIGGQTSTDGLFYKLTDNGSGFFDEESIFTSNFNLAVTRNLDAADSPFFNKINVISVDKYNRVYLGGDFRNLEDSESYQTGNYHTGIIRLLPSGDIDPDFTLTFTCANPQVYAIEFQQNGKILVGGIFTYVNQDIDNADGIVRVDQSGRMDPDFNTFALGDGLADYATVYSIAIEEEGSN